MILNDELEARNDNEIVMREIDPKTLSVMFTTSTPGNSSRMTWTSRWWPTLQLSTKFLASWICSASR